MACPLRFERRQFVSNPVSTAWGTQSSPPRSTGWVTTPAPEQADSGITSRNDRIAKEKGTRNEHHLLDQK
jgi:hypothetical protein